MAKEEIGVPTLTERLQTSTRQAYKIVNGEANVTLATIAALSQVLGKRPRLVFD
jgi:plasmid maintenance system antidote protein VapI